MVNQCLEFWLRPPLHCMSALQWGRDGGWGGGGMVGWGEGWWGGVVYLTLQSPLQCRNALEMDSGVSHSVPCFVIQWD